MLIAFADYLKDVRLNWARRLKRVFGIEIEQCARCGGRCWLAQPKAPVGGADTVKFCGDVGCESNSPSRSTGSFCQNDSYASQPLKRTGRSKCLFAPSLNTRQFQILIPTQSDSR
jgi:hypothetical protein